MDDFDWDDDGDCVAVPRQEKIAVYALSSGRVVVRQKPWDGEDDHVVVIAPENVPAVIDALRMCMKAEKRTNIGDHTQEE